MGELWKERGNGEETGVQNKVVHEGERGKKEEKTGQKTGEGGRTNIT